MLNRAARLASSLSASAGGSAPIGHFGVGVGVAGRAGVAMSARPVDPSDLAAKLVQGDRRSLSRAITLVESSNPQHRAAANELLVHVLKAQALRPLSEHSVLAQQGLAASIPKQFRPHAATSDAAAGALAEMEATATESESSTGAGAAAEGGDEGEAGEGEASESPLPNGGRPRTQLRIGISGTPGVGKSTFIESFGMHLISQYGLRVAVLSIDPSSQLTGGSILGDKTRMQQLACAELAYVRPSPSRGALGGVAQDTAEAVLLCEAAGYDVVLVETVGVGQSEVTVAQTVDMVVLLMNPGGGDELQGIKKGIMELADLLVVTKADGALEGPARRTKADYEAALHFYHSAAQAYGWRPQATLCSVVDHVDAHMRRIWGKILDFEQAMLRPARGIYSPRTFWSGAYTFGPTHTPLDGEATVAAGAAAGPPSAAALLESLSVLHAKRAAQRRQWMWSQLSEEMQARLRRFSRVGAVLGEVERALVANLLTPRVAATRVFDMWLEAQLASRGTPAGRGTPAAAAGAAETGAAGTGAAGTGAGAAAAGSAKASSSP